MNTNIQDFWKALEDDNAVLVVDNDMCYVNFDEDEFISFDFGPQELVFIFAEKLNINAEMC